MNKKTKSSIIMTSLGAIALAGSLMASATYALFTSESKTNIAVTSGKVDVKATIEGLTAYTPKVIGTDGVISDKTDIADNSGDTKKFGNGGTAKIEEGELMLTNMTPGDKVEFKVKIVNKSNVAVKCRTKTMCNEDSGLFAGLKVTMDDKEYDGATTISDYYNLAVDADPVDIEISIELPSDAENGYQDTGCKISITVEALQGNAKGEDPADDVYSVYTPADLSAMAKRISAGTFDCKKVQLENDIDMQYANYVSPCYANTYRQGLEFDGQGYTIENFSPKEDGNTGAVGLIGSFSGTNLNIHDVNFKNASIALDHNSSGYFGILVGSIGSSSEAIIKDVTLDGAKIAGVKYAGSLIGYTSATKAEVSGISIKNVTISDVYTAGGVIGNIGEGEVTLSGLKGEKVSVSGTSKEGGIVGAVSGASLNITYSETDYSATISEEAIDDRGSIVGLTGNKTYVNNNHYYSINSTEELNSIKELSKDKNNIIEIGSGKYVGAAAPLSGDYKIKVVGRGSLDDIKWVQATTGNCGYSFQGVDLEMKNVTITSEASSYYSGFLRANSLNFKDCKILVDHEGGAMGYWGSGATVFEGCTFDSTNATESNLFFYAGNSLTFNKCKFISDETAVKLYKECHSSVTSYDITFNECTFTNNHATSWTGVKDYKSAIQVACDYLGDKVHYNIAVNQSSVSGNYAKGLLEDHAGLIGVRYGSTVSSSNVTLTLDGTTQNLGLNN